MRVAAYFYALACFFIALNLIFGHGRDGLWLVAVLMFVLGAAVSVIGYTSQSKAGKK